MASPRAESAVKILEPNPKAQLFTIRTHSSSLSLGTLMIVITGPNTSSWNIFISAVTPLQEHVVRTTVKIETIDLGRYLTSTQWVQRIDHPSQFFSFHRSVE